MIKTLFVTILAACLSLTGCASAPSTKMVSQVNLNPPTEQIVLPSEDQLLQCFAETQWNSADPQIAIKVLSITDVSGKATYGDNGTGAIATQESSSTAIAALALATGSKSPLTWVDGTDLIVRTQKDEMALGIRSVADNRAAPPTDYYLTGSLVSIDSVMAAVQQVIVYGVGGGPRQERWSFDMNLRLVRKNTEGYKSTSLFNQYVQNEIKGIVSTVVGGGSGKTLLTVDLEQVVRGKMQGMMRPMIFVGVADLLSTLHGAPPTCVAQVQNFLSRKAKSSKPQITAWNTGFPVHMNVWQRKETALAA